MKFSKTRRVYRNNGLIDPTYYATLKKVGIKAMDDETEVEINETKKTKSYWGWTYTNGKLTFGNC